MAICRPGTIPGTGTGGCLCRRSSAPARAAAGGGMIRAVPTDGVSNGSCGPAGYQTANCRMASAQSASRLPIQGSMATISRMFTVSTVPMPAGAGTS